MLPPDQKIAYETFFHSTEENDILSPKTTFMVQMAVAMAIGCYP